MRKPIRNVRKTNATFAHPEEYTGYCFRRFSATILSDCGADLLTVKTSRGLEKHSVAVRYIERSNAHKRNIFSAILGEKSKQVQNVENRKQFQIVSENVGNIFCTMVCV